MTPFRPASRRDLSARRATPRMVRRGSIYVLVLGCALIIFVVGVSTIALAHSGTRMVTASNDSKRAGILARSAMEVVVAWMNQNPSWRTTLASSTPFTFQIEGTKVTAMVVDETDDDLTDNTTDPLRIYTNVAIGNSCRVFSAQATPTSNAGLDVLRCPIHAQTGLTVVSGKTLTASGGPASCNGNVSNSGTIAGDAEITGLYVSTGKTTGLVTNPAPAKPMPSAAAVQALFSGATTVNIVYVPILSDKMQKALLSSASNPFGSPNSSGKYALNLVGVGNYTIQDCRIKASVLVNIPATSMLTIGNHVCWEPADPSLPALVVTGGGTIDFNSDGSVLSESAVGINLNPPSTPYNGVSDADLTDSYPAQINGVVHIASSSITTTFENNSRIFGCLLSAGAITAQGTPTAAADPSLLTTPPHGYTNTASGTMKIVQGSFRWELADNAALITKGVGSSPITQAPGAVSGN